MPAKTLFFTAGSTQTVTGTFTITGASGGQISLLSTSTTPWNLSLSTTGTGAVTWAEIQNSTATGTNTPISAIPATNDTDLGGNTGWNFGGGSSITWGGATSTNWNLGSNWSGGRVPGATDTATVPNVGANFNPILTTNVKVSSLQVTTGTLDLSTFTLTVASATAGSFTVSGTLLLNGSQTITLGSPAVLTGSTIQYYGGGTTGLVLGNSYTNLQFAGAGTWTLNATLTVTGNLTFPSGTPTVLLAGNALNVSGNLGGTGTLTASGSEAISVGGNWTVGTFNPSSSTVTFNGTGAQSASPATFSAVVLSKTAGSFTATSAFNAASLTTGPNVAFAVALNAGGTITGAGITTFSNTGSLTIGASFTFNNGVAAGPGPSAYTLSGTIQNTASSQMNFGSATATLNGNTVINSSGGTITVAAVNAQAAGGESLTLNAIAGAVNLNGAIGATQLSNFSVTSGAALAFPSTSLTGVLTASAGGAITQTAAITQTGGGGSSSFTTGSFPITLTNAGNSFTGPVSLNNSGGNNVGITGTGALQFAASAVGSGTLTVNAGGAITQTGAITQAVGALGSSFTTGNAVITLSQANDLVGPVSLTNTGANNVVVTNGTNPLQIGTLSLGTGTFTVNAAGITQTATAITVPGAATFNGGAGVITLTDGGNNFQSTVALNNSGANNVALTTSGALSLATSGVGSGTLTLNAGGAITQTGAITQAVGALGSSFTTGNAVITLSQANDLVGPVSLTNTGLNNVVVTNGTNPLQIGTLSLGTGTFTVNAAGITQTATAITVPGAATFNGGAGVITLTDGGNNFQSTVALNNSGANNVALTTSGALSLATSGVGSGTLTLNAGGAITQTGAITQAVGALGPSFTTGNAVITLTNAGNNFVGPVSLTNSGANNVALTTSGALSLAASGVGSGTLAIVAGGAITQTGAITQAVGALGSSFTTGNAVITLSQANDLVGPVSLTNTGANNVVVTNGTNPLQIGTLSLGTGTFTVNAAGITQTATAITVPGAATFNGGAGVITLTDGGNNFQSTVALNNSGANNVALTTSGALSLATSGVGSGTLTLNAGGAITQTGAITQAVGALGSSFTTGNAVITLSQANDLVGPVSLTNTGANNVVVTNGTNPLQIGTLSLGTGTFTVNAAGITQTATAITVPGAATFNGGAGVITLTDGGNNFQSTVALNNSGANNVALTTSGALSLATSGVGSGTLTLNAGGAITQTGAITQAVGALGSSFTTGNAVITLSQANDLVGPVSLTNTGANNVVVTNGTNPLQIGTLSLGTGTFTVNAAGITQTATAITVPGAATFNGGAGVITLTDGGNNFQSTVALNNSGANNVALTTSGALSLATSGVGSGTLAIVAGGAITQTGAITQAVGAGSVILTPGAGNTVTLGAAANTFTGSVSVTNGANVTLVDSVGLDLGPITITGALAATATTGNITNAGGTLTIGGNSTFAASAAGASISVAHAGNTFTGTVTFVPSGGGLANVTVLSTLALNLQALTLSGNLTATSPSMTQSGAVSAGGNVTFAGGTLTLNGNNLSAGGSLTGPGLTATASELISVGANWNITTFTPATSTVNFTGNGSIVASSASTFYTLMKSGAGTTTTFNENLIIIANLTLSSGTLADGGSFTITVGNQPGSPATVTWDSTGGGPTAFSPGSGTVYFYNPKVLINGSNTFSTFWADTTSAGHSVIISFQQATTQTVSSNLHALGTSANPITLMSAAQATLYSVPPPNDPALTPHVLPNPPTWNQQWYISVPGAATIDWAIVQLSWASTASITPGPNCTDDGYNDNWFFVIPVVASWTIDKNNNGRIDTIRVQVKQGTQLATAFGGITVKVDGYGTISGAANFGFPPGVANKDVFDITLPEGPSEDTSATPTWQILSNTSLYGIVGGALVQHNTATSTVVYTASKGARPVITYTLAPLSSTQAYIHFSELVYGNAALGSSIGTSSFIYSGGALTAVQPVETSGSGAHGAIITFSTPLAINDILAGAQNIQAASRRNLGRGGRR